MISFRFLSAVSACLLFLPVVSALSAEEEQTISVSGTSSVLRLPDTVRIIVTVQSKGKTVEEALAKLETERKSSLEKLEKIGIAKDRVTADNFGIDQAEENKRRQMRMMLAQRMRQPNRKKAAVVPEVVLLRCTLTAEHSLSGTTAEEILKESCELSQKIKAANFAAATEALTPEEEELAEEMNAINYHPSEAGATNEPRLHYVSNVTGEEARKAYAEAFRHARQEGETLAAAAGVKTGALTRLSAQLVKTPSDVPNPHGHYNHNFFATQMIGSPPSGDDSAKQFEGLAATPGEMRFAFTVQAAFAIQPY